LGIERDPRSITRARTRVVEAGLRNVNFTQCDVSQISGGKSFDAAVGRFILMWVPDPVSVLRSVSQKVRPGGVVAFHEPYWPPLLALLAPLSLWSATASLIHETFRRWGAQPIIPRSGVARTNDAIRDAANSAAISQYRIDVCYASERQGSQPTCGNTRVLFKIRTKWGNGSIPTQRKCRIVPPSTLLAVPMPNTNG
jgi:SAM-dependent methyltransferase